MRSSISVGKLHRGSVEGQPREITTGEQVTVSITATTWHPESDLTLADWVCQGKRLGFVGKGVAWWIGDWLRYGNLRWGERYAKAARVIGYDTQTLMNMVYVASAYPPDDRRPALSWSHHAELAGLDPADRRRWMDLAEEQRMSVRCLRQELRRARRLREQESGTEARREVEPESEHAGSRCPHCGYELVPANEAGDRPGGGELADPRRVGEGATELISERLSA